MDEADALRLSPTEAAVLWLAADHENGEIATALGINSVETVKTHLARARAKLGNPPRKAASRNLRSLVDCPPPWSTPLAVMLADPETAPRTVAVHDETVPFEGFPAPPVREPTAGSRYAADTPRHRLRLMMMTTLGLAAIILLSLTIGRELVRLTRAYWEGTSLN